MGIKISERLHEKNNINLRALNIGRNSVPSDTQYYIGDLIDLCY